MPRLAAGVLAFESLQRKASLASLTQKLDAGRSHRHLMGNGDAYYPWSQAAVPPNAPSKDANTCNSPQHIT